VTDLAFDMAARGGILFRPRFIEADRKENWRGRHVLEYVTPPTVSMPGAAFGRR
jgi:hypothetical protein